MIPDKEKEKTQPERDKEPHSQAEKENPRKRLNKHSLSRKPKWRKAMKNKDWLRFLEPQEEKKGKTEEKNRRNPKKEREKKEYQFLAELNGSILVATFPALTTPTKHTNPSELGLPHFILNLHGYWVSEEAFPHPPSDCFLIPTIPILFVGHKSKGVSEN